MLIQAPPSLKTVEARERLQAKLLEIAKKNGDTATQQRISEHQEEDKQGSREHLRRVLAEARAKRSRVPTVVAAVAQDQDQSDAMSRVLREIKKTPNRNQLSQIARKILSQQGQA